MKREQTIDIAKGLCILLMILGHCQGMEPIVYKAIESFHMPFFFITAGFFYRPQPTIAVVKKSFRRLIVPMLIGVAVCIAIYLALGQTESALNWVKALLFPGGTGRKIFFYPNWPDLGVFWFLAALFWCRIIYNWLYQLFPKHILLICAVLSWTTIIVGRRFILPFCMSEGLSGIVLYAVGHWANQRNLQSQSLKWYVVVFILALWLVDIHFVGFHMFHLGYTWYLYPVGVVFACLMSFLIYKLSHLISSYTWSHPLHLCGLYSLEIMCCHQVARVIVEILKKSIWADVLSNGLLAIILIGLSLVIASVYIIIKQFGVQK